MPISNGVNSDSFSREDVIRMYLVVQYMGGILTQFPVVPAIDYNETTGILSVRGFQSLDPGVGTVQPALTVRGANSLSSQRPGASISFLSGLGSGGSARGSINLSVPLGASIDLDADGAAALQSENGAYINVSDGVYLGTSSAVSFQAVGDAIGFYGATPVARPAVTGSRSGVNSVTISLLNALTALGLVTNSTTA